MEDFLTDPKSIALLITSVISLASCICASTPTVKDDQAITQFGTKVGTFLKFAYQVLELLALNIGKAKQPSQSHSPVAEQIPSHIQERK